MLNCGTSSSNLTIQHMYPLYKKNKINTKPRKANLVSAHMHANGKNYKLLGT